MKKLFVLLTILSISNFLSVAQVNHIVIESEKKIEGEPNDIGGVDFTFNTQAYSIKLCDTCQTQHLDAVTSITATNYNTFPVTVKFHYTVYGTKHKRYYDRTYVGQNPKWGSMDSDYQSYKKNESIVLPPYSSSNPNNSSKIIPVRIGSSGVPIEIEGFSSIVTKVGE